MVYERKTPYNIVKAKVGLTVISPTFILLPGICAKAGLRYFKCPAITNT